MSDATETYQSALIAEVEKYKRNGDEDVLCLRLSAPLSGDRAICAVTLPLGRTDYATLAVALENLASFTGGFAKALQEINAWRDRAADSDFPF